jgi:NAD(P)-dependent dehydrogenase (short-subunit alcohol dehydrogenase family)
MAARWLVDQKHQVVLHARDERRAREAIASVPGAEDVLVGDLSHRDEVKQLAERANAAGPFDAVIHNAGVYRASGEQLLAVNTLAPYILTCLVKKPRRLIYIASGMHLQGDPDLAKMTIRSAKVSYSDSKLLVVLLSKAVARRWPDVYVNAVDPGWVATKMGGSDAPDDLAQGFETQGWLAVSDDAAAKVTGRYLHHKKTMGHHPAADDLKLQDDFLATCEQVTGVVFPKHSTENERE